MAGDRADGKPRQIPILPAPIPPLNCLGFMKLSSLAAVLVVLALAPSPSRADDLAPLPLVLPPPALKGTPPNLPTNTTAEPLTSKHREVFLAPKGVELLSLHKPVTASDSNLITGDLSQITDGRKQAEEENI